LKADIILGAQAGDEGKAKVVSALLNKKQFDAVVRVNGGPNAGHTIWHHNKKYAFRMLPSGILSNCRLLIGAGVLVDPDVLLNEIKLYNIDPSRVGVDYRATIITDNHKKAEKANSHMTSIGSTMSGVGAALSDRVARKAALAKDEIKLEQFITDVPAELHKSENILLEGAQGFELSVLYGNDYPNVTSCDTTASTMCAGGGIGPRDVKSVMLVIKSIITRVGAGSLPGEMTREEAELKGYQEFGTVTGRPRRVSEQFDFDRLRYAIKLNSASELALTKLDARFPECAGVTQLNSLSERALSFVHDIEEKLNVPITLIGTGQETNSVVWK